MNFEISKARASFKTTTSSFLFSIPCHASNTQLANIIDRSFNFEVAFKIKPHVKEEVALPVSTAPEEVTVEVVPEEETKPEEAAERKPTFTVSSEEEVSKVRRPKVSVKAEEEVDSVKNVVANDGEFCNDQSSVQPMQYT